MPQDKDPPIYPKPPNPETYGDMKPVQVPYRPSWLMRVGSWFYEKLRARG